MCNADKVGSLQIFETRESSVEILRQVKHFLRHLNDFLLLRTGNLDQFLNDSVGDQVIAFELLADFQSDIQCTYADQRGFAPAQLVVMHGHFSQIHGHLRDQKVQSLRSVT